MIKRILLMALIIAAMTAVMACSSAVAQAKRPAQPFVDTGPIWQAIAQQELREQQEFRLWQQRGMTTPQIYSQTPANPARMAAQLQAARVWAWQHNLPPPSSFSQQQPMVVYDNQPQQMAPQQRTRPQPNVVRSGPNAMPAMGSFIYGANRPVQTSANRNWRTPTGQSDLRKK
ncbi:MAG: hypothetical protein A2599_01135 [Candidatus Staskawiczbacteria bacterium RIFOXYD1_FULL_39_28]|nr:MAG: hypothetical protein A2599_01135 [Candidatus Staskawiczbacteria bacterium RIFOXYD1_FULL_39_28]